MSRFLQASLWLSTLALASSATAAGTLGTTKTLEQTTLCKTYRCKTLSREKLPGGYVRTLFSLLEPGETDRVFEWDIYELTRGGKVVGVRWKEFFQDDFYTKQAANMVVALSKTVLGVSLPGSAGQTLVNNALQESPDPAKGTFFAGNVLAQGFVRSAGNGNEFHLIMTSKSELSGLSAVDPERIVMTPLEQQAVQKQIADNLGVFQRAAPDCPGGGAATIAVPLGDGVTDDSIKATIKKLGFEFGPGFFVKPPYTASRLFVTPHPNGREACIGF